VCEYCGARLEGTTDVGVDRGSAGQKRKTMLGPMPTMARKPGSAGLPQKKSTRIDPDDPFRIAAQGASVTPTAERPPAPPAAPASSPDPPSVPSNPPPVAAAPPVARTRRATVVTLERPEEPSVAGAAIILPPDGPARTALLREGRTRIGRRDGVEICLDDPKASTDHALLRIEGGEAWLLDTSANGTLVSGTACVNDRADLSDGSVLRVGDTLVIVKLLGEDALVHLATER
jgi:pSer/pThr/pTyr-binding forkhead associated (FHA) protein